jgi:hypothetical protein
VADEVWVARDLLDKQLVDRENRPMGKVDGVVIEYPQGQPPRVAFLETGPVVLGRRFHPKIGRWVARRLRRLGISDGQPHRIAIEKVIQFGRDVKVDLDARRTRSYAVEHWLRDHVIAKLPGSGV